MKRWIAGILLCLCVLPPLPATAADDLDTALSRLPPAQRTMYRRHLVQLDRVSRRLLQAIPNRPRVSFLYAAGESSVNAGATFGKIVVTEGMLRFVRSDDELAMILGHELAHLTQGHVSRGAMNNTLLGIGSIIAGAFIPGGDAATSLVGQLFLNHFNQDQEHAADRVGLQYAYDAGYDPVVAAGVMRRMAEEVPETASSGFFSSHPSSLERFETLQRQAAALSPEHAGRLAMSDRPPGPQPTLKRDEKACQQARPLFYQARDTSDLERKVALYQRGLRLCPQSPRAHAELAEVYVSLGEEREAMEELREALRYDPDYPGAQDRLYQIENRVSGVRY